MADYQLTLTGAQVQALLDILGNNSASSSQVLYADGQGGVTFASLPSQKTYSISISNNIITLTPNTGTASSIALPVYNGGVS